MATSYLVLGKSEYQLIPSLIPTAISDQTKLLAGIGTCHSRDRFLEISEILISVIASCCQHYGSRLILNNFHARKPVNICFSAW